MMPGAQVLVARDGNIVYQKSFGRHEYNADSKKVENTDVYDLASLTKILATLPLIMELIDKDIISLQTRLSELLPEYKGNEKGNTRLIDLLTHYNKLQAWIPFYRTTLDSKTSKPANEYYQIEKSDKFNLQVAEDLYMRTDYRDSIFKTIKDSNLRPRQSYRYSDLPYYLLQKYLEEYYKQPLNKIIEERIYNKIGTGLTYLPLEKYAIEQIPPTENDNYFRNQKIQGYVHDQGAAMMGGVAGHAGLFGNSMDIAIMMQMFLNEGSYAGMNFISEETFRMFNTCYYCDKNVRRGIGFDKPQLGNVGPTCGCVSMNSFGHSGFTGTFAWADPEERIIYVFLSNRTFPNAENNSIIKNNLRSNIQQVIYEAIEESFIN